MNLVFHISRQTPRTFLQNIFLATTYIKTMQVSLRLIRFLEKCCIVNFGKLGFGNLSVRKISILIYWHEMLLAKLQKKSNIFAITYIRTMQISLRLIRFFEKYHIVDFGKLGFGNLSVRKISILIYWHEMLLAKLCFR